MRYKVIVTIFAAIAVAVGAAVLKPVDISYAAVKPAASATPKSKQDVKTKSVRELTYTDGEFDGKEVVTTDEEWKKILTPAEFDILRREGTEDPYTGALTENHKRGTYYCAACGLA